jgi:hypothetical protein
LKNEIQRIHKKEVVKCQLETAVSLFIKQVDYSSVITLAGAAGNILFQLVLNNGKKPFADLGREVAHHIEGVHFKRKTYKYQMEILFGVIPLKHMSEKCDEIIEIDLEQSAVKVLTYALHDYTTLFGQDEPFVKAFYNWVWENKNGPQIVEEYKDFVTKFKK